MPLRGAQHQSGADLSPLHGHITSYPRDVRNIKTEETLVRHTLGRPCQKLVNEADDRETATNDVRQNYPAQLETVFTPVGGQEVAYVVRDCLCIRGRSRATGVDVIVQ